MPDDPIEKPDFTRGQDFVSLYANNVQYEPSVWDLKIVFGELDQSKGPSAVEQHTGITLSWMEAKIAAYFIALHILAYQAKNGLIQIPNSVMPPRPDPEDPTVVGAQAKDLVRHLAWLYDQFFSDHPLAPSSVTGEPEQAT